MEKMEYVKIFLLSMFSLLATYAILECYFNLTAGKYAILISLLVLPIGNVIIFYKIKKRKLANDLKIEKANNE